MKPFNLEAAKAGAKLVTRDGREVTEFHHFEADRGNYPCIVVIAGQRISYSKDGRYTLYSGERTADLFMATVTRTVYVNVYESTKRNSPDRNEACAFPSVEEATKNSLIDASRCVAVAVPVTISE